MLTMLLTRHAATMRWLEREAERRGWAYVAARHAPRQLPPEVGRVAGVFPIALAADWARAGIETWHVRLMLDEEEREGELDDAQLAQRNPVLCQVKVIELEEKP